MRACSGFDGFAIHVAQLSFIDTDLDETGSNACSFDSLFKLLDSTCRQLIRGLLERVHREILRLSRTVVAGVRHHAQY